MDGYIARKMPTSPEEQWKLNAAGTTARGTGRPPAPGIAL